MRFPFSHEESQTAKFFNNVPIKGLGRSFEIMTYSSEDPEKGSSIISIDYLEIYHRKYKWCSININEIL